LATVASRHVWLGLTALSKKGREDLLRALVSTEGFFWLISSVTQRSRSSTGFPAGEGAQRDGETKGEAMARSSRARGALHLFGPPRGTGVPALTAAESGRVGDSVFTELTGGGRKRLCPAAYGRTGGALSTFFRAHFSRGKRVRVCSVSRSPDFSTVTTEVEVSEVQRLLTRKPVRGSEMERCCWTTACVYMSIACESYNEGLRMVTLVI